MGGEGKGQHVLTLHMVLLMWSEWKIIDVMRQMNIPTTGSANRI